MITVDTRDLKKLEAQLERVKRQALPFAHRATLNQTAFIAQGIARKRARNSMTLRNRWTLQSIQVEKAKTLNIRRQFSTVGSTQKYMKDQEFGGVKIKKGRRGVPIPTSFSAGQGEKSRPRLKLPREINRLSKMTLSRRRSRPKGQPKNRRQAILFKIQDAVASGRQRFFYHDFGSRGEGLFKVVGGRRGVKRGAPKGAKIKMLYSLAKPAIRIPRRAWLKPAVDVAAKRMPAIHVKNLRFQLKRIGLLK